MFPSHDPDTGYGVGYRAYAKEWRNDLEENPSFFIPKCAMDSHHSDMIVFESKTLQYGQGKVCPFQCTLELDKLIAFNNKEEEHILGIKEASMSFPTKYFISEEGTGEVEQDASPSTLSYSTQEENGLDKPDEEPQISAATSKDRDWETTWMLL